ncbi:MAG: ATP-binding protein [Thermosynechococcaceae cyanobacterium]
MFQNIRHRLLLSNLLVFSLVLSGFAVVVRVVFVHSLREQLLNQLTDLGKGAAGSLEHEDGRLQVDNEYLVQNIASGHLTIEWFSPQGNLIEQQGKHPIQKPFNPLVFRKIQAGQPRIQAVTLPVLGHSTGQQIGYVRVSQSLQEFDETVTQLDWGLGLGAIVALTISGIGTLWLHRQAMQPIETSFQRLQQFTADASHELRSPLMAIISNVDVSLKYPEGIRPDDREAFETVLNAADQMTQLTENMLLLARTEKVFNFEKKEVNLSSIVSQLVQLYQAQAQLKSIQLVSQIEPDLRLTGDALKLTRAIRNLIQNAVGYTPAGGQVTVQARRTDQFLHVIVEDTGAGIAPKHLEQIFERFWRADLARSYDSGGSGLGLPIAQAIIHQHGGTITVQSAVGKGSCFEVRLPAQKERTLTRNSHIHDTPNLHSK